MLAKTFNRLKLLAFSVLLLCVAPKAHASHIFGIDLYYTHVAGNVFTIHLVVYGDCSGSAFPTLSTSVPVINIYDGATFYTSVNLAVQAPVTGVEVTPVCPADVGNTTCTNLSYPIPGVKKFVYTANVTMPHTSSVWRFLFQGAMGSSSAGRSNSITNIIIPSLGSMIQLVDTLNNTTFNNSNAVYTTIPTPFFCIDVPANFNPAAVDPDGDSLVFKLVPGIDANTGVSVTYIGPYTAADPLAVAAGTFSFGLATGQLSFTPNLIQKSLVVYNVEEWRGGVLRGTSQREMTFVVISPCTTTPPVGDISSLSAGTLTSPTTVSLCNNTGAFNFHINPTDAGGNHITMTATGLPAGATFNVVGNGTLAPLGTFTWNTTGMAPGNYIFYINYQDDGCPLSSNQTMAYTITILPVPTETYALVSAATCNAKAVFHITPGGSTSPWHIDVIQSGTVVQSIVGVTGMVTDSLVPGTYTLRTYNTEGCYADATITLVSPPLPIPTVTVSPPLCPGGSTGSATITASGGLPPYTYAIGGGTYTSSGNFTSLSPGAYVLHIKDANNCEKDTTVTVPDASPILLHIGIQKPLCNSETNGIITIDAYNSTGPYTFAIGSGVYGGGNVFGSLGAGSYALHIKNANGCEKDTTVSLVDSTNIDATLTIAGILCNGGNATVTVNATGGYGPGYTYAYNSTAFGTADVFTLAAGTYTLHVHDPNACFFDTSLTLTQPSPIVITPVPTNVLCNGTTTGSVIVNATGGTPGYIYNIGGGVYGSSNTFTGLAAGTQVVGVKDLNGCVYTATVTLTQPTAIMIDSVSLHRPSCNAGTNGWLAIYAHGGTGSYTYANGGGAYGTSSTFTGLAAAAYTMHVKDANGCVKDTTLILGQPSAIVPAAVVRPSVCNTLANGKVTLSGAGGAGAYTYAMGSGAYSGAGLFSPLAAGTYTFHIKDANGCVKDTTIVVYDSLRVVGAFTISPALCNGQASGTINVVGSGGTSPYTYQIGSGAYGTAHIFGSLHAGSYIIHTKDANGCLNDTTVAVGQPAVIAAGIAITSPSCYGYTDGSVAVAATGGTPGYTYALGMGGFGTATTFGSLGAGTDSITIKDANGCVHDTVVSVQQPTAIGIAAISLTNISCNGGANGGVIVTGTGGTPAYQYAANALPWQTGTSFAGFAAGTQTIKVKDSHGCEIDTTVLLTQPTPLFFASADTVNPTCQGYKNGSIILHAAGGTAPYAYAIDSAAYGFGNAFTSLAEGAYTCYVRDANACTHDTLINLTGLPHILMDSIDITEPSCYGGHDGRLKADASGGVQPLTYDMTGFLGHAAANVFDSLTTGGYMVVVKDSRGCVLDSLVQVQQPDSIKITMIVTPNECTGSIIKGAIHTEISGGTPPYSYLWSTDPAQTTSAIIVLPNGVYSVIVKDTNNCENTASATISFDDCCTPFIPNAFTPNGDGKNDVFRIMFKGDMQIITFMIYNRFGQQVYEVQNTADPNHGWDGKFEGVNAELGVYYYYAKIICGNKGDHTVELKGDVTLVR